MKILVPIRPIACAAGEMDLNRVVVKMMWVWNSMLLIPSIPWLLIVASQGCWNHCWNLFYSFWTWFLYVAFVVACGAITRFAKYCWSPFWKPQSSNGTWVHVQSIHFWVISCSMNVAMESRAGAGLGRCSVGISFAGCSRTFTTLPNKTATSSEENAQPRHTVLFLHPRIFIYRVSCTSCSKKIWVRNRNNLVVR